VGPGFSPLAETLDLGAEAFSPWLLERAVRLGAELPFATAAELVALFTGTRISPSTIRRATVASGEAMRQLELAFITTIEADTAPPVLAPTVPLQLSVDGSLLPLVHGEWREVRVAAIGEIGPEATCRGLSYTATLGSAEVFGREALGEIVRRGGDQAMTVVAVSDGAPWIQGFVDLHCPQARRVLDFAHAAGYLAQAAQEAFGPGTAATSEWFAVQRHELRDGDPQRVLAALTALPAGERRDQALGYLQERRAMIAYREVRAAGFPIGSGCVESAHKTLLQARCKRSGMHWTPAALIPLIALRTVIANERWTATWTRVGPHRRAAQRLRTAARRSARQPVVPATPSARSIPTAPSPTPTPPPRAKLVQHGRPTADHPWRRPFLSRPHASTTKM